MDFALSDRHQRFQQKIRDFARTVVEPVAGDLDQKSICPQDIIDAAARHGMLGTCVPGEHGGSGEDYLAYIVGLEEISHAWAALASILSVHNSLVCYPI